jgi:hypothetical protein
MHLDPLADFKWRVSEPGYVWWPLSLAPNDGPRTLFPCDGPSRTYRPHREDPALFREFARVAPTEGGILSFANRFGNLRERLVRWGRKAVYSPKEVVGGETYHKWCREIFDMRLAVALWDMVRGHDMSGLARHISWRGENGEEVVWFGAYPDLRSTQRPKAPEKRIRAVLATGSEIPDWWRGRSRHQHLIGPALCFLSLLINKHLSYDVSPSLDMGSVTVFPKLQYSPASLSGALWLQLAQGISGNKTYRSCPGCDRYFEVSPGTARKDRLYCSDRCRTRAYRTRLNEAR